MEKTYAKRCLNWRANLEDMRAFFACISTREYVPESIQKLATDMCPYKSSPVQEVDRKIAEACWVPSLLQLQSATEPFLKGTRRRLKEQDTQHAVMSYTHKYYAQYHIDTHMQKSIKN